ncbi:MAG: LamG domain-containing protein [Catenulispora sp.]
MSTATTDASYDVLELRALSYAQTAPSLGIPLDGSVPFTVDCWFRLDGLCSTAALLSQEGAFSLGVSGESVVLQITGLPPVFSNARKQPLTAVDWHHIAVTLTGGQVRMYIDGQFNVLQAIGGTARHADQPYRIGYDLQAHLRSLRVFNSALTAEQVKTSMFSDPPPNTVVADFDFAVTPPVDRGAGRLPITLHQGARMIRNTPALALSGTAFAQPLRDQHVNPGGRQVDPYTVQSWVFVEAATPARQSVFVNSNLESQTGMALYLEYDPTVVGFRVVSLRGAAQDEDALHSTETVQPGVWTNIATTFDGTTLTVYINGQASGSHPYPPIPLAADEGKLMIGAALTAGQPFGTMTLQGYISRLEVWERALTEAEIATYMEHSPDREAEGLSADYDFTTPRARNVLDAHPVGLADGADLTEQTRPVRSAPGGAGLSDPTGRARPEPAQLSESSEPSNAELSPDILSALLSSIDTSGVLRDHGAAFRAAMAGDIARYQDQPELAEQFREAWTDTMERLRSEPTSLPFFLTTHRVGADYVVLCHRRGQTDVAYRVPADSFDECTLWTINLLFIAVAGIFDALLGLSIRRADQAVRYLATILRRPQIAALLAVPGINAYGIYEIGSALYSYGVFGELLTMVVDLGFWAAIRVMVKFGLKLVGIGAADVVLSLVATAATFIVEYTRKPAQCTALPTVNLSGIKFDYDMTATATDALCIRHSLLRPVPQVQWTKGATAAADSPAVYAITRVAGKPVTIQAGFVATGDLSSVQIKADGGGLLGAIDPFDVRFTDGASDPRFVTIALNHHTLTAAGVRREDVRWNWSYKLPNGDWQPLVTTAHRIYVVLAAPTLPWQQPPGGDDHQQLWTDLLDHACAWAEGSTTAAAAAAAVTRKVNEGIGLSYDTAVGASKYTTELGYEGVFLCSQFLDYLATGHGQGHTVNCTDCASIVTTFTNALGGDLLASRMMSDGSGFDCNKIQAIGFTKWEYPFEHGGGGGFSYHEVAWTNQGSYLDALYDACLKVDSGHDPWDWTDPGVIHTPELPIDMEFTTVGRKPQLPIATPFDAGSYRERLATNDVRGIGSCLPAGPWNHTQNGRRRLI